MELEAKKPRQIRPLGEEIRMEFREEEVYNLNIKEHPDDLSRLIVRFLCGKNYDPQITDEERKLLGVLTANIEKNGLSHEQLNELLLLLNQDTVCKDFFTFFFGEHVNTLDDLKQGVVNFRGFAMLCYGNFKFAYRRIAQMEMEKLKSGLGSYCKESRNRQKPLGIARQDCFQSEVSHGTKRGI